MSADDTPESRSSPDRRGRTRRLAQSWAVVVLAGLVVGALIAPYAVSVTASEPATVAVVPVSGSIDGGTAAAVTEQLERARNDPSVVAVVLQVNSPGGAASASEEMYLKTRQVAQEMPVVTSVGTVAASGAYFTAAPSDRIYVKPASIVGSVGVLASFPTKIEPNSIVASTGPNKLADDSQREFVYKIERIKEAFVNAVMTQRGDRMQISRAELAEAGTYTGARAVELGVADRVGSFDQAVAAAAEMAGVDEYQTEVFRSDRTATFVSRAAYLASDAPNKRIVSPSYLTGLGGRGNVYANFLMIPAEFITPAPGVRANQTLSAREVTGNASASGSGVANG